MPDPIKPSRDSEPALVPGAELRKSSGPASVDRSQLYLLIGCVATLLLLIVGVVAFLPRLRQYESEVLTVAAYVTIGGVIAVLLFGALHSTGELRGERFGVAFKFGGPAAMAVFVAGGGLLLERSLRTASFPLTVYLFDGGTTPPSRLTLDGTMTIDLDEPKTAPVARGVAIFGRIPASWKGRTCPCTVNLDQFPCAPVGDILLSPDGTVKINLTRTSPTPDDRPPLSEVGDGPKAHPFEFSALPNRTLELNVASTGYHQNDAVFAEISDIVGGAVKLESDRQRVTVIPDANAEEVKFKYTLKNTSGAYSLPTQATGHVVQKLLVKSMAPLTVVMERGKSVDLPLKRDDLGGWRPMLGAILNGAGPTPLSTTHGRLQPGEFGGPPFTYIHSGDGSAIDEFTLLIVENYRAVDSPLPQVHVRVVVTVK